MKLYSMRYIVGNIIETLIAYSSLIQIIVDKNKKKLLAWHEMGFKLSLQICSWYSWSPATIRIVSYQLWQKQ